MALDRYFGGPFCDQGTPCGRSERFASTPYLIPLVVLMASWLSLPRFHTRFSLAALGLLAYGICFYDMYYYMSALAFVMQTFGFTALSGSSYLRRNQQS